MTMRAGRRQRGDGNVVVLRTLVVERTGAKAQSDAAA